jgi:hypothetical protein
MILYELNKNSMTSKHEQGLAGENGLLTGDYLIRRAKRDVSVMEEKERFLSVLVTLDVL